VLRLGLADTELQIRFAELESMNPTTKPAMAKAVAMTAAPKIVPLKRRYSPVHLKVDEHSIGVVIGNRNVVSPIDYLGRKRHRPYLRPHLGLDGKTPAQAAGLDLGLDDGIRWQGLIKKAIAENLTHKP